MGALAAANVTAARAGYASVTRQRTLAGDAPLVAVAAPAPRPPRSRFPVSSTDSRGNHTGGWSLERPLLGEACSACGVCALFCPEGAIVRDGGHMEIDLRYCKGCGICEVVCPVRGGLAMEGVAA